MSWTKRIYFDEGYRDKPKCKKALLNVGVRFEYFETRVKITHGTWEIISNEKAPYYLCRKVLKNGNLSSSKTLQNQRNFSESEIYRVLN
ncbi:hypothetical protein [Bacillus massiliigorillae]|uniref:hypothetical protein n=1 Tax=Bacillus massiliigorillae TaxID=1243664 RepID=UPI0005AA0CDD|nr:hypothetical protein [Bacillus massiliigorillae]